MRSLVVYEMADLCEGFLAVGTGMRFLSRVNALVLGQRNGLLESKIK